MLPVPPIPVLGRYELQVDLVNQLGGLQGVAFALTLHQVVSQAAQFRQNQGEQLVFGFSATLSPSPKKLGDVPRIFHRGHGRKVTLLYSTGELPDFPLKVAPSRNPLYDASFV